MTEKADFTEEEWKLVLQGPTSAGLLVVASDPGGSIRESFSMAKAYAEARQRQGESELLDAITSAKPEVDKSRPSSSEELRERAVQHLRDALALLERKATPDEVEDYKRFIVNLAERVAEARKEGFLGLSGDRVSPDERAALQQIAEALGTEAPSAPDAP